MHIPDPWAQLGKQVILKPSVVLVMGKGNSGKSTLTRYLARCGAGKGLRVAVVDADLGQASFGPPTCLSLTFEDQPSSLTLRFVGATHPARHILQVVVGVHHLVERAKAKGAELVLVDTSGMVQGSLGHLLKLHKIELVRPDYLLVLKKSKERLALLDRIPEFPNMLVCLLPPSHKARARSAEERTQYRRKGLEEYFQKSPIREISLEGPRPLLVGPFPSPGRLVGLLDVGGETMGLGVVREYSLRTKKMRLITPVPLDGVHTMQCGSLRLREDWSEIGALRP